MQRQSHNSGKSRRHQSTKCDFIAELCDIPRSNMLSYLDDSFLLILARVSRFWALYATFEYHLRHTINGYSSADVFKALLTSFQNDENIGQLLRNAMYIDNVIANPISGLTAKVNALQSYVASHHPVNKTLHVKRHISLFFKSLAMSCYSTMFFHQGVTVTHSGEKDDATTHNDRKVMMIEKLHKASDALDQAKVDLGDTQMSLYQRLQSRGSN